MTSVTARQKYRNYRGDTKRQTSEKKGSRKVKRWRKTNQNPGAWIGYRVQELVSKENKNENKWAQKVESLVFWCRREWNQGPHKQLMLMPPNPSHSGRQHVRRLQHARKNLNNKTITYIYIYIHTYILYIYIYVYFPSSFYRRGSGGVFSVWVSPSADFLTLRPQTFCTGCGAYQFS